MLNGKKKTPKQSMSDRAQVLKIARAEDMRERLQASGLLNQITGIQGKLLDDTRELSAIDVARLAKASDNCFKLLNKILPDLKSCEVIRRSEDIITIDQLSHDKVDSIRQSILQSLGVSESLHREPIVIEQEGGGRGENSDAVG